MVAMTIPFGSHHDLHDVPTFGVVKHNILDKCILYFTIILLIFLAEGVVQHCIPKSNLTFTPPDCVNFAKVSIYIKDLTPHVDDLPSPSTKSQPVVRSSHCSHCSHPVRKKKIRENIVCIHWKKNVAWWIH